MANNITKYNRSNRGLSLFDDFFDSMFNSFDSWNTRLPAVDVEENKDNYLVKAELPGFNEDNVKITVEDNVLRISGEISEKDDEKDKDGKKYIVRERRHKSFERSFSLPETVKADEISAEFKNGLLTVTLPKKETEEPKKIEVKINK